MAGKVGGWRGHPNSLAALDAGRLPFPLQPRCAKCSRVRMRGDLYCLVHSGRRRRAQPDTPGKAAGRVLQRMHRLGLLPGELVASPLWLGLSVQPTALRTPLRLRMVLAWDMRHRQPLVWAGLVREAHGVAARPSRRWATLPLLDVA